MRQLAIGFALFHSALLQVQV